jgi:hypothetical protein
MLQYWNAGPVVLESLEEQVAMGEPLQQLERMVELLALSRSTAQ